MKSIGKYEFRCCISSSVDLGSMMCAILSMVSECAHFQAAPKTLFRTGANKKR